MTMARPRNIRLCPVCNGRCSRCWLLPLLIPLRLAHPHSLTVAMSIPLLPGYRREAGGVSENKHEHAQGTRRCAGGALAVRFLSIRPLSVALHCHSCHCRVDPFLPGSGGSWAPIAQCVLTREPTHAALQDSTGN